MDELIEQRKADHLRLSVTENVEARIGPGWQDVHLVHEALPEVDTAAIDLSCQLFGRQLRLPLVIAGMTGGHATAREVNAVLARAAERHGLAMGVGSQRPALREADLASTYSVVREEAPTTLLIGNIGAPQLIAQGTVAPLSAQQIADAVGMIRADALAVHLNFLQESVQPEGDRSSFGCAAAIGALVQSVGVPVIAKETGAGLSRSTAVRLRELGVAALDVGGVGGTSFAAIEGRRAATQGADVFSRLGAVFHDWGVPTAVSIVGASACGLPLIATGGIRTGLDAAKAFALGASFVGVARPLLQAALEGDVAVDRWIAQFRAELATALFLTGCSSAAQLQARPRVIVGATREWLVQLGYLVLPPNANGQVTGR